MQSPFEQVGHALFGVQWKAELAQALDVSERTLQRWHGHQMPIPAGVYQDLARLCRDRAAALVALADDIDAIPLSAFKSEQGIRV